MQESDQVCEPAETMIEGELVDLETDKDLIDWESEIVLPNQLNEESFTSSVPTCIIVCSSPLVLPIPELSVPSLVLVQPSVKHDSSPWIEIMLSSLILHQPVLQPHVRWFPSAPCPLLGHLVVWISLRSYGRQLPPSR